MSDDVKAALSIGDCVLVGSLKVTGTVVGFTAGPLPGVKIKLHRIVNDCRTCVASPSECTPVKRYLVNPT